MSNAAGGSAQFFRHPLRDFPHTLQITLPPPGRNPENAPVLQSTNITLKYSCRLRRPTVKGSWGSMHINLP